MSPNCGAAKGLNYTNRSLQVYFHCHLPGAWPIMSMCLKHLTYLLVVSFICFLSRVWAVLSLVLTSCTKGHPLCSFFQTNMVGLGIPDSKTVVCRYAVLSGQVTPL